MSITISGSTGVAGNNGTAGTPTYQGEDTNTGIFFPAADTVAVATGGTERVRVDSSGNVGIGVTPSSQPLEIKRGAGTGAFIESAGNNNTPGSTSAVYGQDGSGNAFAWNRANFPLLFGTNNAERARIDTSGNLGLGCAPSAWIGTKAVELPNNQGSISSFGGPYGQVNLSSNAYGTGNSDIGFTTWRYAKGASGDLGAAAQYRMTGAFHQWFIAPSGIAGNAITFTNAMTLDSSGNLLVGTTSQLSNARVSAVNSGSAWAVAGRSNDRGFLFQNITASGIACYFTTNNDTQLAGQITVNNSTATYSTSSDYRLKENVQPMQDALTKIAQLNPVTYTWKADGSAGQGFIAHELQAVVPDCVTGEKDAMREEQYEVTPAIAATYDAEGNVLTEEVPAVMGTREVPSYQGVDTSFLVATLVAAIKELKAEVDSLKAQLEAQ
jgi:hypothetical protein